MHFRKDVQSRCLCVHYIFQSLVWALSISNIRSCFDNCSPMNKLSSGEVLWGNRPHDVSHLIEKSRLLMIKVPDSSSRWRNWTPFYIFELFACRIKPYKKQKVKRKVVTVKTKYFWRNLGRDSNKTLARFLSPYQLLSADIFPHNIKCVFWCLPATTEVSGSRIPLSI